MATLDLSDFVSPLPHPGEHLREKFLPGYNLTAGALIERLIREQQSVTADTALRLAKVFGTSSQFWINLQTGHDLSEAAIAAREELAAIQPVGVV